MYTKQQALREHRAELKTALRWKDEGRTHVSAETAGYVLADGRAEVPIDEYISLWEGGIKELELGIDPELYNY